MSNRNIFDYSPYIVGAINLIRLYLDVQDRYSLMKFSLHLACLWLILILVLMNPLASTITSFKNNIDIKNTSKYLILCILITLTNYSFITMGFSLSYTWALIFSTISIIAFLVVFIVKKNDLIIIWQNNTGKIILIISLSLCLIVPSAISLIDPMVKEPKMVLSPEHSEIYIENSGGSLLDSKLVIKNIKGYAWDVEVKTTLVDDIFLYFNEIRYDVVSYDYFPIGRREEIKFSVATSYYIEEGKYNAEILLEYSNAKGHRYDEKFTIPIFVGEIPPVAGFPWTYVILALVLIAVTAYYLYEQRLF